MLKRQITAVLMLLIPVLSGIGCATHRTTGEARPAAWRDTLKARTAAYGHRNVIAIVDSAYPSQCAPCIEMVVTGEDQLTVVTAVLAELSKQRHVRHNIVTDAELPHVAETDAPGISQYRAALAAALKNAPHSDLPHEKIIASLDESSRMFNVLLLKTNLSLPYTSVFIWLDCGYWSGEAEKRLRASLSK